MSETEKGQLGRRAVFWFGTRRLSAFLRSRHLIGPAALLIVLVSGIVLAFTGRRRPDVASPLSSSSEAASPVRVAVDFQNTPSAGDGATKKNVDDENYDDEIRPTGSLPARSATVPAVSSPAERAEVAPARVGFREQTQASRRRPVQRAALAAGLLTLCAVASMLVSGISPAPFAPVSSASMDMPLPPIVTMVEEPPRPDCTILKCVALTFDDGPDPYSTPALLDILESRGVPANFFVLGSLIQGNEDVILRMQRLGMGVENHTWSHPNLAAMSPAAVTDQLARTNAELARVLGYTPKYMRPPYGAWTPGYTPTFGMHPVLWELDPQDWLYRNSATVTQNVVNGADPGEVILLHDIHQSTVDAVPMIIDGLRERGFTFVVLDDIFAARPDCPVEQYCTPAIPYASPAAATAAPVSLAPALPAP